MLGRLFGLAAALCSCEYTSPFSAGAMLDGPTPDAGLCEEPGAKCADGTTLRTCVEIGQPPMQVDCTWGCRMDGVAHHCGVLQPAGAVVIPADADPAMLATFGDVTLTGTPTIIDANNGTISGVASGFGHRTDATISVFRFNSLTIDGPVQLIGTKPVALVANGAITINAIITAKGVCGADGAAVPGGPGGFAGGAAQIMSGLGPGGGIGSDNGNGAGGGGHGATGGNGGTATNGGSIAGIETIDLLVGGSGGGASNGAGGFGRGGGGGGAVQVVSNTTIVFSTAGGIDAGGCGGDAGEGGSTDGGGGGGAGGTILLEAPTIGGPGQLAVNGGGGGGGDSVAADGEGRPGSLGRTVAPGGTGGVNGDPGGAGGAALSYGGGSGTKIGSHGGGGGGAIGRIRLNTRGGVSAVTGEMSPAITDTGSTATDGSANVR